MPVKRYDKGEILDACFEVFVKKGYANTTTVMLSEAAGISKALLFHHFKSKKKIYISVLDRCFEKMAEEIEEESLSDFIDFFQAKEQSGLKKIEYLRQNPDLSKILYEAYVSTPDELRDEIHAFIIHLNQKYGSVEQLKNKMMKELFDEIPLREGVNNQEAFELVNIVADHFRKKIAAELTDEKKILDDEYWENLFSSKRKFLDMVRYGIEENGR